MYVFGKELAPNWVAQSALAHVLKETEAINYDWGLEIVRIHQVVQIGERYCVYLYWKAFDIWDEAVLIFGASKAKQVINPGFTNIVEIRKSRRGNLVIAGQMVEKGDGIHQIVIPM